MIFNLFKESEIYASYYLFFFEFFLYIFSLNLIIIYKVYELKIYLWFGQTISIFDILVYINIINAIIVKITISWVYVLLIVILTFISLDTFNLVVV